MNLRLLVGIVIFLIGLVAAGIAISNVGNAETTPFVAAEEGPFGQQVDKLVLPIGAGLSLALGGLLIGLSMGRWKHPRTHLEPGDAVVDPEGYHKMKHV